MDIASLSLEELSSASDTINEVEELIDAAKYMVSDPNSVSKEDALEILNVMATIMGVILSASAMLVDIELISRPPTN